MLKWILGTAALTVLAAIVITWQAERCEADRQECETAAAAQPLANPMLPVTAGIDGNTDQQQAQNEARRACAHSQTYFCRLMTPANLPTIYLVLKDENIGPYIASQNPVEARNGLPIAPGFEDDFPIEWKIGDSSEIDDVRDGKKNLYVFGYLQYRSTIDKKLCHSYFCFHHYRRRNADGNFTEGWSMEPAEENYYS